MRRCSVPEDLFETISQTLLNAIDRDAYSGLRAMVTIKRATLRMYFMFEFDSSRTTSSAPSHLLCALANAGPPLARRSFYIPLSVDGSSGSSPRYMVDYA
jgi:hypothetical protein